MYFSSHRKIGFWKQTSLIKNIYLSKPKVILSWSKKKVNKKQAERLIFIKDKVITGQISIGR